MLPWFPSSARSTQDPRATDEAGAPGLLLGSLPCSSPFHRAGASTEM